MAAGNADHTVQSTKLGSLPLISVSKIWEPPELGRGIGCLHIFLKRGSIALIISHYI